MKITDVKCAVIGNSPVVRIVTDEGISGYGQVESYKPYLKNHVLLLRDALLDQRALLQQVTYSMCVANADLHAKNLSLLHDDGVRLAPLYDVVATSVYTDVDAELGLQVGGEYHLDDITRASLVAAASRWGLGATAAARAIDALLDAVDGLVDEVAAELPAVGAATSRVEQAVATIRRRAAELRE